MIAFALFLAAAIVAAVAAVTGRSLTAAAVGLMAAGLAVQAAP